MPPRGGGERREVGRGRRQVEHGGRQRRGVGDGHQPAVGAAAAAVGAGRRGVEDRLPASRRVGRDDGPPRGEGLEDRAGRALAIRGEHVDGAGAERGPDVVQATEVLDGARTHPAIELLAAHGCRVGIELAGEQASRPRGPAADLGGGGGIFADALVGDEAAEHQEDGRPGRQGAGREIVERDAGAGDDARLGRPGEQTGLAEAGEVVGVLEDERGGQGQGAPVKAGHREPREAAADAPTRGERVAEAGDHGDPMAHARVAGGAEAMDDRLVRVGEDTLGAQLAHESRESQAVAAVPERGEARAGHGQRMETDAHLGEPGPDRGIILGGGRMDVMPGGAQGREEGAAEAGERGGEARDDEDPHGCSPRRSRSLSAASMRLTTNLNLLLAPFSMASGYS